MRMTLDEAIEKIKKIKAMPYIEHLQLLTWLVELKEAKKLLREALPILRKANFFPDYDAADEANKLYDKITKVVGKE